MAVFYIFQMYSINYLLCVYKPNQQVKIEFGKQVPLDINFLLLCRLFYCSFEDGSTAKHQSFLLSTFKTVSMQKIQITRQST